MGCTRMRGRVCLRERPCVLPSLAWRVNRRRRAVRGEAHWHTCSPSSTRSRSAPLSTQHHLSYILFLFS